MEKQVSIKIENLAKQYRLGAVGISSFKKDLITNVKKLFGIASENELGARNLISKESTSDYVWALKDIDLEINKGDVIGFIGKNGAGKSTLLKILSRVTTPTEGKITINGRIASLLEVGTGFHPELSGKDNIYLNGAIMGMSKEEISNKFDEIVDFAGVSLYINTPVKRYSSGMYVRLAFAVAAHLEPEILIVDEVLAVGDAAFQKKAIAKMTEISKMEGRTVLFVSHNMASIQNLCNKCVVLESGVSTFCGDTKEAIDRYLSSNHVESDMNESIEYSPNRTGNGNVQFANFHMETVQGMRVESLLTGQDVVFVFKLKVNKPVVNAVDISFSIHDAEYAGLANIYSSYQNSLFNGLSEGYHVVKFTLQDFSFSPGTLFIQGRILEGSEEADWYKGDLKKVEVEMGDFYKTGEVGQATWGSYLIKGEWGSSEVAN